MTDYQTKAAEMLAARSNDLDDEDSWVPSDWNNPLGVTEQAAVQLLAEALGAADKREEEIARVVGEIGAVCDAGLRGDAGAMVYGLRKAVNLSHSLLPKPKPAPMTVDEAVKAAVDNLGTWEPWQLAPELDRLGFTITRKDDHDQ